MRILLLGGTGLIGGATREALLAAGHELTVLSRRPLAEGPRLRVIPGDRGDGGLLDAALAGQRFEMTVDFLAYDAPELERLFAVPGFWPGRFVMISTGQVYLVSGRPPPFVEADAEAPALPEPEPETVPWYNWVYGMGKRRAEATLRETGAARGFPTLALRVPAVQGEADGACSQRLWGWLERLLDGGPVLLPDDGVQRLRFVYVGDVAEAIARLAGELPWPEVSALNLAQPEECTLRSFVEQVAACAGVKPRLVSVPSERLARLGLSDCAPYAGRFSSRPDPSLALSLGLHTRGPEVYLPPVVRAHLEARPARSHEGYARRAEELAVAESVAVPGIDR